MGVGDTTNEQFMESLANIGGGIYYKPTEKQNLKLLFGDIDEDIDPENINLVITDSNEFITKGQSVSATISGYNRIRNHSDLNMVFMLYYR